MKVRIAVAPSFTSFDPVEFTTFLTNLEQLGFDTVWLSDIPMGGSVDPLVALSYASSHTTTLKLGTNIVPLGHNPMMLAKQLAQLDHFSGGRLLLSFVPGIDQPGERAALGVGTANRGAVLDKIIGLVRAWWAGEAVTDECGAYRYDEVTVRPRPKQDPLEIWLGGMGPIALARAGRLADGWLGAVLEPEAAGAARRTIQQSAIDNGRAIDDDHFGLSMAYARVEPPAKAYEQLLARRPDADPKSLLPVGRSELRDLVKAHIDNGISKFVLRLAPPGPATMENQPTASAHDLQWLADAVLDLQN